MGHATRDSFPGLIPIGGGEQRLYMQVGKDNFDGVYTDTSSVSVRTLLTDIDFASAQVYDTQQPATDAASDALFVNVAPASGAIVIYRSTQAAANYGSSGMPFRFVLIGRVQDTN